VRDGGKLWVVAQDSTVEVRSVDVRWKERDRVVVGAGLVTGDQVIISALSAASTGMLVRVVENETAKVSPGALP
jgi:multidrug efflux pump subunit AcrA (membrane-fusion protein)